MSDTTYRKGNFFQNNEAQVLVVADEACPPLITIGTKTAGVIPLNEDILEVLGFVDKGAYYEDNKGHIISFDMTSTYGILKYKGIAVKYLNELQDAFEDNQEILIIDREELAKVLSKLDL